MLIVNPVLNTEELEKIIGESFLKNCYTNNYLLPDFYNKSIAQKKLLFQRNGANTILLVDKDTFFQVYFYLNDMNEPLRISLQKPAVMEILYRGSAGRPENLIEYWCGCDFTEHLTRDNLIISGRRMNYYSEINEDVICSFTGTRDEIFFTHELLVNSLDNYTGNILSIEDLYNYAEKGRIIFAYWKGEIAGALQFDIRNNIAWLDHISVAPAYRGQRIAKQLVNTFISANSIDPDMKFSLWVRKDNVSALNLYAKFGFSYANKSTVSLVKINN